MDKLVIDWKGSGKPDRLGIQWEGRILRGECTLSTVYHEEWWKAREQSVLPKIEEPR